MFRLQKIYAKLSRSKARRQMTFDKKLKDFTMIQESQLQIDFLRDQFNQQAIHPLGETLSDPRPKLGKKFEIDRNKLQKVVKLINKKLTYGFKIKACNQWMINLKKNLLLKDKSHLYDQKEEIDFQQQFRKQLFRAKQIKLLLDREKFNPKNYTPGKEKKEYLHQKHQNLKHDGFKNTNEQLKLLIQSGLIIKLECKFDKKVLIRLNNIGQNILLPYLQYLQIQNVLSWFFTIPFLNNEMLFQKIYHKIKEFSYQKLTAEQKYIIYLVCHYFNQPTKLSKNIQKLHYKIVIQQFTKTEQMIGFQYPYNIVYSKISDKLRQEFGQIIQKQWVIEVSTTKKAILQQLMNIQDQDLLFMGFGRYILCFILRKGGIFKLDVPFLKVLNDYSFIQCIIKLNYINLLQPEDIYIRQVYIWQIQYHIITMVSFNKVLNSLIQLLSLSAGRDKTCRLVQYFCKYLETRYKDQYQTLISQRSDLKMKQLKALNLGGAMGMTRKIIRFGPSIVQVKTIITNIIDLIQVKNIQPDHIVILKTLDAFFLAMFFICDHYIWLFRVGITSNEQLKTKCDYYSALGWLLDCITTIFKDIAIYLNAKPQQRKQITKDLAIDLVRVICDIPVSYSFLIPNSVDGKIVGSLGTLTSLIGIYQMWK